MNLINAIAEKVNNGSKFRVDFKNKTLKVDGKYWIKDGKMIDGIEIPNVDLLNEIDQLYTDYYYSRPSERSTKCRHLYFKAKKYEDMTDEEVILGKNRESTRAKLECLVLSAILNGWQWKNEYGSWYWKSNKHSDLVLLRGWFA